jgi:hypothetical protein
MGTRRGSLMLLALMMVSVGVSAGCSSQCRQVRSDYRQAVLQETELSQELEPQGPDGGSAPAQFGLALQTDMLEEVANTALQATIKSGLQALSKIDVGGGQQIDVRTRGNIVNLSIEASDACRHCFKVGGDLDGAVGLDVPLVGRQSANLDGSLNIVAPLLVERGKNGGAVLKLDLPEAARIGKSTLNARLTNLRSSWARVLQSKLSDVLLQRLMKDVDPVDLLSFDTPDFGIPGLEVFPVELVTDAKTGVIFAGFATNIEGLQADVGIEPVTNLEGDQNIAFAFNPNLVVHGVSLMMKKDVVPRTYSTDGEPMRGGPAHAVVNAVRFTKGRVGELPMTIDFSVFNMPESGFCFWFDGSASGRIALSGQNLAVSLTDVAITQSSVPGLVQATDWMGAEFLEGGKRIVKQSLDDQNVAVPGGELAFKGLALELNKGTVVLKGVSAVTTKDAPQERRRRSRAGL